MLKNNQEQFIKIEAPCSGDLKDTHKLFRYFVVTLLFVEQPLLHWFNWKYY